jgi:Tfp pilus assembly protein PilZ
MERKNDRAQTRYRVHLSVRFQTALEFVTEYAENLSHGGLFVRGAHHLEFNREVPIQLEVPGYPPFKVVARVAHILTPEIAEALKRKPGAGLHIVRGPRGFQEAIRLYLTRLGRRRDRGVLAGDHQIASALEAAGYRTQIVPTPQDLVLAVEEMEERTLGVVVLHTSKDGYARAAEVLGKTDFVYGVESLEEVDELLPVFDEML